jgi:hypothetical protein
MCDGTNGSVLFNPPHHYRAAFQVSNAPEFKDSKARSLGRSRWPRACSSRTSYGDALAVALTERCVHFLKSVCLRDTPDLPGHVFQKYLGTRHRCL